ncbi:MAG TPA: permease prefix domain 1-containing protein [bacterium]|nr:permease prefix domain 1-containing protein [bacterium]
MSVDRYLDRLFDLLAGTGSRGRRALTEAEAHLSESVEALTRQGRSPEDAAREAIARFGPPESVARAVITGGVPFWTVARQVAATVWLLGAVALMSGGLSGSLNWWVAAHFGPEALAPDAPAQTYSAARCAVLLKAYPQAGSCRSASVIHHSEELVYRPIVGGVFGLILLTLFGAARRNPRLRILTVLPPSGTVTLAGLTAFGGAAGVLALIALQRLQLDQTWGIGANVTRAAAVAAAALVFLPGAWREVRRRAT